MRQVQTLLTCCGLLFLNALPGQQFTAPGKITLANGNYLEGQIAYTDWTIPPTQVTITPKNGQIAATYPLSDLREVEVTPTGQPTEYYRVFEVQYDTSIQRIDMLDRDPQGKFRTARVLLRQSSKGGVYNLYTLTDDLARLHLFVQIRDSTPIELLRKHYLSPTGDSILTNRRYQKQLTYLLSNSADLSREAAKVEYTEPAINSLLVRYAQEHYFLNYLDVTVVNDRPRGHLAWGVTAGSYFTMPFFKKATFQPTSVGWKPSWSGGAYLETWMPRSNSRWSYRSELLYGIYRSQVSLEQTTYKANTVNQFDSTNFALRWNNLLRLGTAATGANRFYGGGGFGIGYLRNLRRNSTRISRFAGIDNVNYTSEIFPKPPVEFSVIANAGYQRGRWGLEARFDYVVGNLLFRQNYLYPTRRYSLVVLASYQITRPHAWRWRRFRGPSPNYSW